LTVLHFTNGTAIIPLIREAGIAGPIIPWNDVLHDGPVPIGLNPVALRQRRAAFLASCGWGSADGIGRELADRDAALERLDGIDEIVLWFEHDLYDQLQFLQIVDRLPLDGAPRLTAVSNDEYLGLLSPSKFQQLFVGRRDVTSSERLAARDAWKAFCSPDPRALTDVLPRVSVLPHMGSALSRHLEQFPSVENGLSRTEQQALEEIASGVTHLGKIYARSHHARESAIFMGDAGFLAHLSALVVGGDPLLRKTVRARSASDRTTPSAPPLTLDDEVELTDTGRRVLANDIDRVRRCGIDRWLGGVHLLGNGPVWRWDAQRQTVRFA
jgi:hypothetical protein